MWKFSDYADSCAAVDELRNISYSELENAGDTLAKVVGGRALVFCLCRNTIGSLIGYTGFINNGIVPLLLDEGIDKELLSVLTDTYKPMYLWMASEIVTEFKFKVTYQTHGFSLLKTDFDQFPMYENLALLLTTSGSTGSPKLVRQSYKNILSNTQSIVEYLEIDYTERPITTLPMNYTYGLSIINSHLFAGGCILMTTKGILQREFWQFFKENKATSFGGIPYTYEMLKKLRFFKMDLPTLRTMTQAGGKLSPELHREYAMYAKEHGKRFYVMYGQTEATARMSYLPYKQSLNKYGSIGISIPGGTLTLIDVNGNEIIEPEIIGELVYCGDNVTLGYAERGNDLIKRDEFNGVLHTGDMAKLDRDGFYYIVGRKKRFLKIFGNRVNLDEAERLIKTEFDVECCCVGIDDKMSIYITSDSLLRDVKLFIAKKTGLNPSSFEVKFIKEIPKNEAGKTLYSALEGLA
ncbi:MAG: AMP-binding protein [Clostridiales bacterium]|jgi:acyl-CoA synthetase (AMP-forming)/AMP-acid ligase II|nr:AMP-binding protein [Clostridiales bacterium]